MGKKNKMRVKRGSSNEQEQEPQEQERKKKQLYLVVPDSEYRTCMYSIDIDNDNSEIIKKDPILRLGKESLPLGCRFGRVNSKIVMVGGLTNNTGRSAVLRSKPTGPRGRGRSRLQYKNHASSLVHVYDTVTCQFYQAPPLNSGKRHPILFVSSSKLFALSNRLHDTYDNPTLDPNPRFEVIDISYLKPELEREPDWGWRTLPLPLFQKTPPESGGFYVKSWAFSASEKFIFISIRNYGTFVFDVVQECWDHNSPQDLLPFIKEAKAVNDTTYKDDDDDDQNDSTLLYGITDSEARNICAFRLHYNTNTDTTPKLLLVEPISIVDLTSSLPFKPISPTIKSLYHPSPLLIPVDSDDGGTSTNTRLCMLVFGLDKRPFTYDDLLVESVNHYTLLNVWCANKIRLHHNKQPKRKRKRSDHCDSILSNHNKEEEEIRLINWKQRCFFAGPTVLGMYDVFAALFI